MFSLKYLIGFIVLIIGFCLGVFSQFVFQSESDQKTFSAVLESSNFWGKENRLDYGHSGNWDERPEGIEQIDVSVKLISPIDGSKDGFLVAYQITLGLKPQADKPANRANSEKEYFVSGYGVDFDFYFLDEDGYCLEEISTKDQKANSSPGTCPVCIHPDGRSELIQGVLVNAKIPAHLAKRIKKVCYWPVFQVRSWKPKQEKDESNKTIKE
jgi:hypothetical protein